MAQREAFEVVTAAAVAPAHKPPRSASGLPHRFSSGCSSPVATRRVPLLVPSERLGDAIEAPPFRAKEKRR
jgi:hypothetical protein